VSAVVADYSCDQPLIFLDRSWLKTFWNDTLVDGILLFLDKNIDLAEIRKEIYDRLSTRHQIFVYSAKDIRKEVTRAIDQMFLLVHFLEVMALVVAIIGIFNTLWSEVLDRGREISLLLMIGMLSSQLRRCFAIEASLLGIAGAVLGIAGGLATSYYLIRQMVPIIVGWSLPYTIDWTGILRFCGLIFIVTILTGYVASYITTRKVVVGD